MKTETGINVDKINSNSRKITPFRIYQPQWILNKVDLFKLFFKESIKMGIKWMCNFICRNLSVSTQTQGK